MKDTIWIKKGRFTPLALLLMLALPLVTSVVCLCFGRMNVPVGEVLTALRTALTGGSAANVQNYSIVINLRLQNSRIGRAWQAIREDEIAAKAVGINVRQ
jgi:ABC-type branched-subunit amino acid transport system permease subunit